MKSTKFKKKFKLKTEKADPQEIADKLQANESDIENKPNLNGVSQLSVKSKKKRKLSKTLSSEENVIKKSSSKKDEKSTKSENTEVNETSANNVMEASEPVSKKKKKSKSLTDSQKKEDSSENKTEEKPSKKTLSLPSEIKESRDSRTVFVGNLPTDFKKKKLLKLFSTCGEIEKMWTRGVIPDTEKISKKIAFAKKLFHKDQLSLVAYILYKTTEGAQKALTLNGDLFEDRHLRVTLSNDKSFDKNKGVFVGNLPFNVTDDEVWDFFKDCDEISSVRVIRDLKNGLGKGFGYVNFKSADGVELALKLNDKELQGRQIRVKRLFSEGKQKKLKKKKLQDIIKGKSNGPKEKSKRTDSNDKNFDIKFKKLKKTNKADLKKKKLAEKLLAKPKKKEDMLSLDE